MPPEALIAGVHPVYEALVSEQRPIDRIHIARGTLPVKVRRILDLARERGIPVRRESREALDRIARGVRHQGVIALAGARAYASLEEVLDAVPPVLIAVLDEVQDPHNLGAVIRTAEAAGASGVVITQRHSAPLSEAAARASAGALEYVPVARASNLVSVVEMMKSKGIWVVGLDAGASRLWTEFDYTVPVALVLGGEQHGIRRLVRESCDLTVRLPVRGKIQSLNVSVAAGVALYEVVRQRAQRSAEKAGEDPLEPRRSPKMPR